MTEKTTKTDSNIRSQMRKGILEYCVLLLLSRQRAYPSDIISGLNEASLIVVEGTLYTLLNRLRKEGKLNYEWEESPKGPPRKYYFITGLGKETLDEMSDAWDEIVSNVNHFRKNSSFIPKIEDSKPDEDSRQNVISDSAQEPSSSTSPETDPTL